MQLYETTSTPTSILGTDIYTGDHSGWRTVNFVQQIDSTVDMYVVTDETPNFEYVTYTGTLAQDFKEVYNNEISKKLRKYTENKLFPNF